MAIFGDQFQAETITARSASTGTGRVTECNGSCRSEHSARSEVHRRSRGIPRRQFGPWHCAEPPTSSTQPALLQGSWYDLATTSGDCMAETSLDRWAGVSGLLLAAIPSVSLGLMAISDAVNHRGGDHMPVAIGVPPLGVICLVVFGLSLPWIIVSVLLLFAVPVGRWLALVLTLPTIPIVLFVGGAAVQGMWGLVDGHQYVPAPIGLISGLFALLGMAFCFTVWKSLYLSWCRFSAPTASDSCPRQDGRSN